MMADLIFKTADQMSGAELAALYSAGQNDKALHAVAYALPWLITADYFFNFASSVDVFCGGFDVAGEPWGFFYLDSFEGETARLHFCPYRSARADIDDCGRRAIDWCFKHYDLQCLIGIVPEPYFSAADFARRMGGREMGKVPGIAPMARLKRALAGHIFIFERGDYMGGLVSKPKAPKMPKVDTSAADKAKEQAAADEKRKQAIEAENLRKKRNTETSGRKSTILAGENGGSGGTVLGG